MSIHHLLEDFAPVVAALTDTPAEVRDNELLDSFEQGYKAGWEDAIRAKSEEQTSISADLARSLQDMSLTFHEARSAVMADIAPVIEQIVCKTIPALARETIGLQIIEQLVDLAEDQEPQNIEILVSPQDLDSVQSIVPDHLTSPATILGDPQVVPGQSRIRFGARERQIDVENVMQNLRQALAGFVHQSQKEVVNG